MQVPSPTAFERHERRQVAASVLALGLLAALIVPIGTFAAPQASSVWVTTGAAGGRSVASEVAFGQRFVVGLSTREKKPWALAICYPNQSTTYTNTFSDADGHIGYVWGEYYSVYDGGPAPQNFILGDGYANWTSGGADCVVELVKFTAGQATVLASSSFAGMP